MPAPAKTDGSGFATLEATQTNSFLIDQQMHAGMAWLGLTKVSVAAGPVFSPHTLFARSRQFFWSQPSHLCTRKRKIIFICHM